jgi:hypothetical protein
VPLPSNKAFGDVLFFAVLDPTEKPGTRSQVVVMIGKEARAIRTIRDFQQLIIEKRVRPASAETALDIAKQYVFVLGFKYPQYTDKVKILNSLQDILLRVNESVPAQLQSLIRPPEVQKQGGNFLVHVFAWSEVGGELRGFDFRCSKEGRFEAKVNVLRESLGKAWLPK